MPSYRITWEIDVDADSPREAAHRAREIQLDPEAWVGCFEIREDGSDEVLRVDIDDVDLDELDEIPVRS